MSLTPEELAAIERGDMRPALGLLVAAIDAALERRDIEGARLALQLLKDGLMNPAEARSALQPMLREVRSLHRVRAALNAGTPATVRDVQAFQKRTRDLPVMDAKTILKALRTLEVYRPAKRGGARKHR